MGSVISVLRRGISPVLATLILLSVFSGVGVAQQSDETETVSVVHDMRGAEYDSAFNESGSAVSISSNTEVRVSVNDGFIRVNASNPNGYPVKYEILLPESVVDPATLGTLSSVEGEPVEARWETEYDVGGGSKHTKITTTVSPGKYALIAPTKVHTTTMSWAQDAKERGSGIISTVTGMFESDLEQRKYTISPEQGEAARVEVALTDESGNLSVEDWHATYTSKGETRPLTEDKNNGVYVVEETDERVVLQFANRNATVEFTANPTVTEEIQHGFNSYLAGWEPVQDVLESIPLSISGGVTS